MQEQTVAQVLGVAEKLAALSRLTSGAGGEADLAALDDDWTIEEWIDAELGRVGLAHLALDRRMASLSGGEATRVVLASLLLRRPDLLILDEPTNNLDGIAREALYAVLAGWTGGLLVVSHDRTLLRLVDRIIELTPRGVNTYGGNYDRYVAQRDAEADAAQRRLDDAAKELRRTRREAQAARERQQRRSSRGHKDRDRVGMPKIALNTLRDAASRTTARVAVTHERQQAAAAEAHAAAREQVEQRRDLQAGLPRVDLPAGKLVLELVDVSFRYPGSDRTVLDRFNLRLVGPERVAVVGANGSGKTTLLRLLQGERTPDAGTVRVGVEEFRCLDQRGALLDPARSVLENFQRHNPGMAESDCRVILARFLFRTDAVHKPAGALSGGEKLRAALACVLNAARPPELLLLDEPTNHLDLPSLENLEQALRQYTGALLVVSHDRDFLQEVGIERMVEMGTEGRDE